MEYLHAETPNEAVDIDNTCCTASAVPRLGFAFSM
jgi:hypothetical protein